ncbi:hypothetical protein ACJMK2_025309 [Sinanodonta woodiana]|uniref:Ig-like domain-containing protein n=1 Tax=Sinanodonta woodiana TaxID=1069815 RepID=A0ABD3XI27_SINWO
MYKHRNKLPPYRKGSDELKVSCSYVKNRHFIHTFIPQLPLVQLLQIQIKFLQPSLISFQGSTLPLHAVARESFYEGGILEISNITRSEAGNYTCIIAKDDVTASTSVMVSVIEANSPIGVLTLDADHPISNGTMVLVLHDTAMIDCHSQRNDVTYTWQFNGSFVLPSTVNARNHFLDISFMTGAKAGNYTCIVSTNGLATSASVWVSVKEEKVHVSEMTTHPSHPWTDYQLDIVCHVTGYPEPIIRWTFTDPMGQTYIPPGLSNLTPNKIHIQNFQPSLHSGTWTCMARNSLGVDQKSIQL